ncbi:MAG TPA: response regulator transcription factor [Anaerolineales bacterium]
MRALIVDDDLALADIVSFTLRRAGFDVSTAYDGLAALQRWEQDQPDIIILDLNLPKLNGLQVCKRIRADSDVPILILSVRGEDDDIVNGLREGADDYVVKPFSPRQLIARIEALLRRSGSPSPASDGLTVGEMRLDPARSEIFFRGELSGHLTHLENELLQTLLLHRDQVLSADALIDHVWGQGGGDRAMLKQLVYRLRRKIGKASEGCPDIETIPGVGYSLVTSRKAAALPKS